MFRYLFLLITYEAAFSNVVSFRTSCTFVEEIYDQVPKQTYTGNEKICDKSSCCSSEMEHNLSSFSHSTLNSLFREMLGKLADGFSVEVERFDEFFKKLLRTAKSDFHQVFLRTYGIIYDTNSFIFFDMFEKLEEYYLTGTIDITSAFHHFFNQLYKKMFQIMHSGDTFDEKYLNCIANQMDELKPFGDGPSQMISEVKRTFVSTHSFKSALSTGNEVIRRIGNVGATPECNKAFMKMMYCPYCNGLHTKTCKRSCLNVMKSCLLFYNFKTEWNQYIDTMLLTVSQLESIFNLQSLLDPIIAKILDVTENFHERGYFISEELFKHCGRPRRSKRNQEKNPTVTLSALKSYEEGIQNLTVENNVSMILNQIKRKIVQSREYWNHLSHLLCNQSQAADSIANELNKDCSATGDITRNEKEKKIQKADDEILRTAYQWYSEEIMAINSITDKLKNAYSGHGWWQTSISQDFNISDFEDIEFEESSDIFSKFLIPKHSFPAYQEQDKTHFSGCNKLNPWNFISLLVLMNMLSFNL